MIDSRDYLNPDCDIDQSAGLNRLLIDGAGKEIEILPGIYNIADTGVIHSGTSLHMRGATIKAHETLPVGKPLLQNLVVSGSVNSYYDTDIQIHGGKFDGAMIPGRTNSLLGFLKTKDLLIDRVEICNNTYMGIAIGGSLRSTVSRCELHHTGKPNVTAEGGAAVWFGTTGDNSRCLRWNFIDNFIHDTEWSAIYGHGRIAKVHGNQFANIKESAYFGNIDGLSYLDNHTRGVYRKYISASGIEIGGPNNLIADSTFEYIENSAVSLTDVSNTIVHDLNCSEIGIDMVSFPQASVVEISTQHPLYSQCNGNNVHDIRLQNSFAPFAMLAVVGSGKPISDLRYSSLLFSGSTTSGASVYFQPGTKGSNVVGYI